MTIAWVTPLSPESAIGRVTVRVAEALGTHADVVLWCSDRGEVLPTQVPVVRYTVSDAFERALREYDTVIYSFGDSYPFHRDVFLMSRRVPGIAILHDFVLHHFFAEHYRLRPGRVELYLEAMERWYGAAGRAAVQVSFQQEAGVWAVREGATPLWETDRVVDYPLFEEALRNATGIVVHSNFLLDKVRAATEVPVRRLHLPAEPADALPEVSRETLGIPEGRAVLLTVGHVNPNKRIDDVIEVLGRHPDLAARVIYVVIGDVPAGAYADRLRETIARHALQSTVRMAGRLPDEVLQAWLRHADICLTLRHPVMEGASASLAGEMMAGKAVIVSDAGIYAEMPGDSVIKVTPGREAEQLPAILHRLLEDPAGRHELAGRARAHAEAHFRAERYAAGLVDFIEESGGFAVMARFADNVGAVLTQMGVRPGMPIVGRVARESAMMLGEPITSPWKPGPG